MPTLPANKNQKANFLSALDKWLATGNDLVAMWQQRNDSGEYFHADDEAPLPDRIAPPMSFDEWFSEIRAHYYTALDPLYAFCHEFQHFDDLADFSDDPDVAGISGYGRAPARFQENPVWIQETASWRSNPMADANKLKGRFYTLEGNQEWLGDNFRAMAAHVYTLATGKTL